jgi:cytochrome b6-f complex iron-sulfur subunit
MSADACSRRSLLKIFAGGAAVGACASPSADPEPFGTVQAGTVPDYPVGSLEPVGTLPVALGRDEGGLYAMTLTCSHTGCNMAIDGDVSSSGAYCWCHGSRFDANGSVTHGPAEKPLAHFQVTVDADGVITIDGDTRVARNVRTPVG